MLHYVCVPHPRYFPPMQSRIWDKVVYFREWSLETGRRSGVNAIRMEGMQFWGHVQVGPHSGAQSPPARPLEQLYRISSDLSTWRTEEGVFLHHLCPVLFKAPKGVNSFPLPEPQRVLAGAPVLAKPVRGAPGQNMRGALSGTLGWVAATAMTGVQDGCEDHRWGTESSQKTPLYTA